MRGSPIAENDSTARSRVGSESEGNMTFALALILALLVGSTSAKTGKPNDPPMIAVAAPAGTHGAIFGVRSGSVPSSTRAPSHRTSVRPRINRT